MKEIIRIHLAKVAYDIELEAKKELKSYMTELEQYANDADILLEIELRITELLDERGVAAGSVITKSDVEAVRRQLGEPKEFADEAAPSDETVGVGAPVRRLYRDEDTALLGGVLSGVAQYFGLQPIWMRLLFVVLLFASFGTALVVYVILWIVVPPARTAAEKLALEGKHATLAAIKERSERLVHSENMGAAGRAVRNTMLFCLGLMFAGFAVVSLVITGVTGFFLLAGGYDGVEVPFVLSAAHSWYYVASVVLFIVSGLLLALLNIVLASTSFRRTWTRRTGISVAAVVVAGMVTFAAAFIPLVAGVWYDERAVQRSYKTVQHDLPSSFAEVTTLTLQLQDVPSSVVPQVTYTVSDTLRYELSHPEGVTPEVDIEQQKDDAVIVISAESDESWHHYYKPMVHLYGPALEAIEVSGGAAAYANEAPQSSLVVTAKADATITLEGSYITVEATAQSNAHIWLEAASVERLVATTQGGAVGAGVVRDLEVSQPTACPARFDDQNSIELAGVTSGEARYNGEMRLLTGEKSIVQPCGVVEIDEE